MCHRSAQQSLPIYADLFLDGCLLGLATETGPHEDHDLHPIFDGQRAALIRWTDDVPSGDEKLLSLGATPVKLPEPWLDGLLISWVGDADGHLVQVF